MAKIVHFKKDCISCGACEAINEKFWKLEGDDGLAQLQGATIVNGHWELEISDADVGSNQETADVCPVNIIHVVKEGEDMPQQD